MNLPLPSILLLLLVGVIVFLFVVRAPLSNRPHQQKKSGKTPLPLIPTDARMRALDPQAATESMAIATVDIAKIIEAQSQQAIVFRQHFPPSFARSLSYFGGAPTAPASFNWPHWQSPAGQVRALTFIMQIDCSEIPPFARLGVLPADGVIYFFLELAESLLGNAYRVIHHTGPTDGWVEVPLPAALPPAVNKYHCKYAREEGQLSRVLPRWPFTPTVINIPAECYSEREADEPYLWPGVAVETLKAAQGEPVIANLYSIKDFMSATGILPKPFATFPHDWRAVQYVMGMFMEQLEHWKRYPTSAPLDKQLPTEEKQRQLTVIHEKAQQFYTIAAERPANEAVPASQREAIWAFLDGEARLARFGLADAVTLAVEDSLARTPESAALIPPEVAERIRPRHALVAAYEGKEYANTPERMLAPPTDVQGGQWEWAGTHLLLLELSSGTGLGRNFAEGVCQLYITPDDLQACRFDKVKLEFEAY